MEILINSLAEGNLSETQPITSQILKATFSGNPALTVIIHYASVEGISDMEEHYEHYDSIAVNKIPKHDVLTERDIQHGKEDANHTYHDNTSSNGKFMLEHATECNLCITNTSFKKRMGKTLNLHF